MQESQFGRTFAEQGKRWLLGNADLGSALTPFTAGLAAPVSLDMAQPPQAPLTSTLMTVSVDLNTLTQEHVRLRATLEALNSTLSSSEKTLAAKTSGASAGSTESKQETARSWGDKGLEIGTDAFKFLSKEVASGLWDKAKDRLSGKTLDKVTEWFPNAAKWLKDDKGKDSSTGKACCCTGTLPADIRGPLTTTTAEVPESVGETIRKKDKTPNSNKRRGQRYKTRQSTSRAIKSSVVGKSAELKSQRAVSPVSGALPLNVMGQPQLPFDRQSASQASTRLPGSSFTSYAVPSANRPLARRSGKGLAESLSGALAKLESTGARRLGPMRYVDTALSVADGVRNGDAKAIGAGLSSAGGAWAGASAGAALGTLVFPGVGTAVGGAIGGLLGSEVGTWLGDKLFGTGDRLPAPGAVGKDLNAARTDNVQVSIAPSIQITGVNPADAQQVVNQVIQALQFQCVPMVTDALGIRRNTAMTDPPGGD